jgi:hypothetical protein
MKSIIGAARFNDLEKSSVHIIVHFTNAPIMGGSLQGKTTTVFDYQGNAFFDNLKVKSVPIFQFFGNGNNQGIVEFTQLRFYSNELQGSTIKVKGKEIEVGGFEETLNKIEGQVSVSRIEIWIDYTKNFDTNSHEIGHAYYSIKNPEKAFLWSIIERGSNWFNQSGAGHLFNNPSGISAHKFEQMTPSSDRKKSLKPTHF